MGRFIREEFAREGVDVRGVLTDPERLTALVVLGIRNREIVSADLLSRELRRYGARASRISMMRYLASTRAVLINGTHLSTPGVFAASLGAARRVKAKWRTCGIRRGLPAGACGD